MGKGPRDLFGNIFGGGDGGIFGGGRGSRPQWPKTEDLIHRVQVTLEDLYKGKTMKITLTKEIVCSKCKGNGGKVIKECTNCLGHGTKEILHQLSPTVIVVQQTKTPCDDCQGTGEVIDVKDLCGVCKGKKVLPTKTVLKVHIKKGTKAGQTIELQGKGNQAPNKGPGDVVIVIEERPHDRFRRRADHLTTEVEVDLLTALAGGQFAIKHLDNRALVVKIGPGELVKYGNVNKMRVVRGQGMPSQRQPKPGNLYIKFNVKFPHAIDQASMALLERALPSRTPIRKFKKDTFLEQVTLEDTDAGSLGHIRDMLKDVDEDCDELKDVYEDDDGPHVECAHQ